MTELLIFAAAFASVFLGCFQAINVVHGRHVWTAVTSVAQSCAAFTLYHTVPDVTGPAGAAAFIIAGVVGGQLSLLVTKKTRNK
jgi:hypothetical protein